jgi:periplasmic divalent cation tolerance protein
MHDAQLVQVQVAHDDREALGALLRQAVEERLAACGQLLGPMTSTFHWDGDVQEAEEWLGLLKTSAGRLDALVAFLADRHPYDVPEVIATPVTGGLGPYLAWVTAATSGA